MKNSIFADAIFLCLFTVGGLFLTSVDNAKAGQIENVLIEEIIPNNVAVTKTIVSRPGVARIRVHFAYANVYPGDFLWTGDGATPYVGNQSNFWSGWLYGGNVWIGMFTNLSLQSSYKIDMIEYEYPPAPIKVTNRTFSFSNLNYGVGLNGYSPNVLYLRPITLAQPAQKVRVHFKEINTELGRDFVLTAGGDKLSGHLFDIWSAWMDGRTAWTYLSSDAQTTPPNGGYLIDAMESQMYAGAWVASDGWSDTHSTDPLVIAQTSSPHAGDGNSRFMNGYDFRPASAAASFVDGSASRAATLSFAWDKYSLQNLQMDGKEAMEMEIDFYGYNDSLGGAWMVPDSTTSDTPFTNASAVWSTDQPAAYLDTHYGDSQSEPSFAVGVTDASQYVPDHWYYWKMWSSAGSVPGGRFKVIAQRSYNWGYFLNPAYNVFSSDHETDGYTLAELKQTFLKRYIPGIPQDDIQAPNVWNWYR